MTNIFLVEILLAALVFVVIVELRQIISQRVEIRQHLKLLEEDEKKSRDRTRDYWKRCEEPVASPPRVHRKFEWVEDALEPDNTPLQSIMKAQAQATAKDLHARGVECKV